VAVLNVNELEGIVVGHLIHIPAADLPNIDKQLSKTATGIYDNLCAAYPAMTVSIVCSYLEK
jgi:hypothetical protein